MSDTDVESRRNPAPIMKYGHEVLRPETPPPPPPEMLHMVPCTSAASGEIAQEHHQTSEVDPTPTTLDTSDTQTPGLQIKQSPQVVSRKRKLRVDCDRHCHHVESKLAVIVRRLAPFYITYTRVPIICVMVIRT